ncbi:23S rRNA (guanosine(2251)-2'-O)-methyltransferase RlmB [Ructibacterium gallinarum]|uniref:23S rRNA (Guanosine(2251)-2'-O)-methyltransferase RlmB n=1 Tax=Ructibacterium gallinarum TaxID=2779355 RepID=A0A9D5M6X9_9FIRM|nr:23S rRNA (guanosine(2251)-2'-O)-methyltransferase RlmB [Ructibacterium gallinarum]MBE5040637.1 23S rRNA (guanosine(2251)-2'-O)-methyltransferase RlmB [Ructibacterium gallinarum]
MKDDIIYGRNPVIEALEAGKTVIDKLLIQDGLRHSQLGYIHHLAKEKGLRCQTVDKRKLDQLCGGQNHQGVIALTAIHTYAEISDILALAKQRKEPPFLVITEGITDPHNLGSIIRTANAAGAHGVIIPKNRSVGLNATVAKVSAGAVEYTLVARVTNIAQTLNKLKDDGLWIVGTDLSGTQRHDACDLTGPIGIVIGSEGAGMSRLVRQACDFLVKIPMVGEIESLNASVAAGILLYEAVRQRRQEEK